MSLPTSRTPGQLPRRLPVGATYVVEGYGGEAGQLRVIARYIVLPGGRRINVPASNVPASTAPAAPRTLALRRRAGAKRPNPKSGAARGQKKYARRGTG